MSAFDTGEMAQALPDIANGTSHGTAAAGPTRLNPEQLKEAGWVEPQAYNYEATDPQSGSPTAGGVDDFGHGEDVPEWAHNAKKYEWSDEYGEVGPRIPELEHQLFRSEYLNRRGIKFDSLCAIKVVAEAEEKPAPILSVRPSLMLPQTTANLHQFDDAGLHPVLLENIKLCGYELPTPIQAYGVPAVMNGHDIIAVAQTGSGKTAAFLIPILSKLMGKAKKLAAPRPNLAKDYDPARDRVRAEPLVLVVAPTRELCCQIFDESRRLCYRSMLRPCVAYGGGPVREQLAELQKGCDILVATPGRLIDVMSRAHVLSLARVRFTVIDEADELLHDDWDDEMSKIMAGADTNEDADHRYLLFSATFGKDMRKVAKKYLANDHVRIRIGRAGSSHMNVTQQVIWVEGNAKQQALYDLLVSMPPSRTLVFVKSKKTADFVDDFLFNNGLPSTSIHSDRTQREREDALRAFRSGKAPIMVATGVSARGLDIRNVMHVINFDLPAIEHNGEDEYIHRIGRTARIGNEGLATSFYNDKDEPMADFLIKTLIECKQPVPDFFRQRLPEDIANLDFNDDSGAEEEEEEEPTNGHIASGGDVWGSGGAAPVAAPVVEDAWTGGDAGDSGAW